jgi:hypothetical protein
MPLDLLALFLLVHALGVVTLAALLYSGFRSPQTRFALVVTFLLVFAVLTLASLAVWRSSVSGAARGTREAPPAWRLRAQAPRSVAPCLRTSRPERLTPRGCGRAHAGLS